MNFQDRNKSAIEETAFNPNIEQNSGDVQTNEAHIQFARLLNNVVGLMGEQFLDQVSKSILEKCKKTSEDSCAVMRQAVESILKLLLHKLQMARSVIAMDPTKGDYEQLQEALQKKEAEVRHHLKLQMQQKIYQTELEETISALETSLAEANSTIMHCQQNIKRLQKQKQQLVYKVEKYEERLYELSRGGGSNTLDKKSSEILIHKASLNIKHRVRLEPYLENSTKTKQVLSRSKEVPRYFRQKASRILCFDSINNDKRESADHGASRKSMFHQLSKVIGHSSSDLGEFEKSKEVNKRRKAKPGRQLTEMQEGRDRHCKSIYIV